MLHPFYTIGHARRPISEFVNLLQKAGVTLVADVRAIPRSRTNPQYNRDVLPQALAAFQIGYEHIAALGGRRRRRKDAKPSLNTFWRNEAFRNYADYAATEEFRAGFDELRTLARRQRCAIMCAETVWWRCHRRIITDYLLADGIPVAHIMGNNRVDPAKLTPGARLLPGGILVYSAAENKDSKASG